mmetsp:Transcript_24733/g.36265  ORF Transcript_24733/g.36265 Transcript_24733/m.36265 type:complete len:564 (+) Transcript_24733:106-1797(+)
MSDTDPIIGAVDTVAVKMNKVDSWDDLVVGGSLGNNIGFEPLEPCQEEIVEGQFVSWPLGLHLNLISTCLYMTNYFIAGPTSVRFMDALGADPALASMLIGATPWAVLVSTFIFSIWTNYTFRKPLLLSSLFLCLGNLIYALALRFQSVMLVMGGRILIGMGGPRAINRRYIADTATLQQRTAISAAFVTFSATGVSLGPALSVMFQSVNHKFEVPLFGTIVLNGLTAPGYFMFFLWLCFLVILGFYFDEPERIGLEQQNSCKHSADNVSLLDPNEDDGLVGMKANTAGDATIAKFVPWPKEKDNIAPTYSNDHRYGTMVEFNLDKIKFGTPERDDDSITLNLGCLRSLTWPVWMCMMLLFVNKLSIESLTSSNPLITESRYNWTVSKIGMLNVGIGLLVIPLSICIGWLSRRYDDGKILIYLLYFTVAGLALLIDFNDLLGEKTTNEMEERSRTKWYTLFGVGPNRYIYGCLFAFSGLQAMESIIMSTLSKVVPYSLAAGTFNSGLLNTEVGTFGRAIGDVFVTYLGFISLDNLLDALVTPLLLILLGCIIIVKLNYDVFSV